MCIFSGIYNKSVPELTNGETAPLNPGVSALFAQWWAMILSTSLTPLSYSDWSSVYNFIYSKDITTTRVAYLQGEAGVDFLLFLPSQSICNMTMRYVAEKDIINSYEVVTYWLLSIIPTWFTFPLCVYLNLIVHIAV